MTVNEVPWNWPEIICCFTNTQQWVLWWSSRFSPLVGLSRIKLDVLRTWSPSDSFTCPSAIGNIYFSPFWSVNTFFELSLRAWISDARLFQLLNVCDQNVSFPDFTRVQRISKEYTRQDFWTELMQSRQVFLRNTVIFYFRNNGDTEWFAESPFVRSFPIWQEILNVSQIAVTFHRIRPPTFVQTWLHQYCRCPFFNSAYRSFSNTICLWTVRCWRAMIAGQVFTSFAPNFRELSE